MAASTELQFLLTAKDDASAVISGMGGAIENAKGSILAFGATATAAFAAFSSEISDAVSTAEDFQNTQAQLAAVIKSTGGASGETVASIDALGDSLQKTTGYSADTIEQVDTLLAGMKDIGTNVMPSATQAILDFAARTGTDAVSAADQLGKALADPSIAIGTLTRQHIILSQAQQDAIKQFNSVGDVAGAQKVIIDALNSTVGGAAEQTNTAAYQQRMLNSEMEDFQNALGKAVLPALTSLLSMLQPVIAAVTDWTTKHPELTKILVIFVGVLTGMAVVLTALAGAWLLVDAAMSPVILVILAVVAAVALLVAAAVAIHDNWDSISAYFSKLWADIQKDFQTAINAIIAFFQPLLDMVNSVIAAIEKVASTIGSVASAVGGAASSAIHAIIPHAAGGSVNPYSTYLVGENGPELFTSDVGGSIMPNSSLAGAGGQNININIAGAIMTTDAANQLASVIMQQLRFKTRIGI